MNCTKIFELYASVAVGINLMGNNVADSYMVFKVGVNFDSTTRTIGDWKIVGTEN